LPVGVAQLWIVRRHSRFVKHCTPLVVVALLVSLFVGCSKRPTSSASFVIEPGVSVGPVHSGMTMKQVVAELGEPEQKVAGGLLYRNLGFIISFGKGGTVQNVMCGGKTAFLGHTKEGIGIGASHADIVRAYGEPSAANVRKPFESMGYDSLGIVFVLRDDKVHMITLSFKP
jgi:hypothetical protein